MLADTDSVGGVNSDHSKESVVFFIIVCSNIYFFSEAKSFLNVYLQ
jgi:hypothetical protein